jgi:hypothetical protein
MPPLITQKLQSPIIEIKKGNDKELVKSDKYSILRQKVKVELYEIIKG